MTSAPKRRQFAMAIRRRIDDGNATLVCRGPNQRVRSCSSALSALAWTLQARGARGCFPFGVSGWEERLTTCRDFNRGRDCFSYWSCRGIPCVISWPCRRRRLLPTGATVRRGWISYRARLVLRCLPMLPAQKRRCPRGQQRRLRHVSWWASWRSCGPLFSFFEWRVSRWPPFDPLPRSRSRSRATRVVLWFGTSTAIDPQCRWRLSQASKKRTSPLPIVVNGCHSCSEFGP